MKFTKKDRTVKAEFDPTFQATAMGGLFLMERLAQRIGAWTVLGDQLPARNGYYSSGNGVSQLILGLMAGGRGLSSADPLRDDPVLSRGLGYSCVAEDGTMNRVLADIAGLEQRKEGDVYILRRQGDLFEGKSRKRGRRQVGEIEYADPQRLKQTVNASDEILVRLLRATNQAALKYGRWIPVFGDGSQLEVRGRCFDAALLDRNGNRSEQLAFTTIGPFLAATELRPGTKDEGLGMPELMQRTMDVVHRVGLPERSLLFLLDSAFGERQVLEQLHSTKGAKYIIGVNGMRKPLQRLCEEQPRSQWVAETRLDGWLEEASYCAFCHRAETWNKNETFIAIRYREKGELFPKYSFMVTNLTRDDIRKDQERLSCSSYMATLWAMYRYKQGMENYQKPALSDMGLHHPPSGRFGINQVFYVMGTIAYNLATFLSRCTLPEEHRGMRLWRMRCSLFRIAGLISIHARTTSIRLSTGVAEWIQHAWMHSFRAIQRI